MTAKKLTLILSAGACGLLLLPLSGPLHYALADAPAGRYAQPAAGEIQDTQTGLVWEQAPKHSTMSWSDAQAYCNGLGLNGHSWRLASIKELQTLVDESRTDPAIDTTAFPGESGSGRSGRVWSSSASSTQTSYVWYVHFYYGRTYTDEVTLTNRAWCVR